MNPTKHRFRSPLVVLCLVLFLGVIGCSKSGKVKGKVFYDGKPVPVGTITFHPEKGKAAIAEIEDGEYTVDKVPPGPVVVTVSTQNQEAQLKAAKSAGGGGMMPGGGGTAPDMKDKSKSMGERKEMAKMEEEGKKTAEKLKDMVPVPDKYWDKDKSGLKYDIVSGSQEIEIQMPKVETGKKPK